MQGKELLRLFGFHVTEEPKSIYPYSPVYRVQYRDKDVIVKRTQKNAASVIAYIHMLKEQGIHVVTPVELQVDNPQKYEEINYIVYPFIEGQKYVGKEDEIYAVGKMLGQIHAISPCSNRFGLLEYDVYDFNEQEVTESMESICQHANKAGILVDKQLKDKLLEIVTYQRHLLDARLPHVATPHDFKANNLIFTPEPFLIDPDNAIWLPRIFDLALTLLLFHNEHVEAPNRVFTKEEWALFMEGYKTFITLTEQEKLFWEKAIQHVFLDEVMWLMAEYEEDWQSISQQNLFKSVIQIMMDSRDYPLL